MDWDIKEDGGGLRRQTGYLSMDEEDDAVDFLRRYNPPEPPWNRTGDCTCEMCGQIYSRHRLAWPWMVLHRICNGDYVKL